MDSYRGTSPGSPARPADYETDVFWVVYILAGYEEVYWFDYDGTDQFGEPEGARLGGTDNIQTDGGGGEYSVIFVEALRDTAETGGGTHTDAQQRALTVVHEIGHQFDVAWYPTQQERETNGEHRDNPPNIMSSHTSEISLEQAYFHPQDIAHLRRRIPSPGVPLDGGGGNGGNNPLQFDSFAQLDPIQPSIQEQVISTFRQQQSQGRVITAHTDKGLTVNLERRVVPRENVLADRHFEFFFNAVNWFSFNNVVPASYWGHSLDHHRDFGHSPLPNSAVWHAMLANDHLDLFWEMYNQASDDTTDWVGSGELTAAGVPEELDIMRMREDIDSPNVSLD